MRRTVTPLLLLAVPLALGACGGDDDGGPAASPSTGSSAAPSDPASAEDPVTSGGAAAETVTIAIEDFAFDPDGIEVAAGTEVVWTNADDFAHTAEADDGSFDTGTIEGGGASSEPVVLEEPGTYEYFCGLHNSMTGTLTVTG